MKNLKIFFLLLFIFTAKVNLAESFSLVPTGPHRLYIGPEIYHLDRKKEGGSKQKGYLYGGYATYERRRHGGLYWAADGYYAYGRLKGETASGRSLKSEITEYELEGRIGYSFCKKNWKKLTLIPYGGYGYFNSKNDFKKPSPLICEYKDDFYYGAAGFEISFFPHCKLECGLDFQTKFMTKGESRVLDDTLMMENEKQYELDLLFRYYTNYMNRSVVALLSPFYQFRHYGGKANHPFDFIDTKFQIYGVRFLLNLSF